MRSFLHTIRTRAWVLAVCGVAAVAGVHAEDRDAERSQYVNYAVNQFAAENIEQERTAYYDLFGQHLINGSYIYSANSVLESFSRYGSDSLFNFNDQMRDKSFFINFNNICYSSDRLGGNKSTLIIGEQIPTKFTPLTINKMHFNGIRWDLFRSGTAITALMTRTRPSRIATRNTSSAHSYVYYPSVRTAALDNTTIQNYNNSGDDWSFKSMFGDYDMFYGFHGEKSFGDALNVGMTVTTHHRNDIKNGESWIGELPKTVMPDEIHFEIYDMTPGNLTDPGARLVDVQMYVNGAAVPAKGLGGLYHTENNSAGNSVLLEYPDLALNDPAKDAHGKHPLVCTFYPGRFVEDAADVKDVSFDFKLSGNYLVFVSTEKMTPLYKHWGVIAYGRDNRNVYGPVQLRIKDIVGRELISDGINERNPFLAPGYESDRSEVYFGDYIARAPRVVTNYGDITSFSYTYRMMVASVVAGINANGSVYGFDYNGELALNMKRYVYPSVAGNSYLDNHMAGYLHLDRKQLLETGLLGNASASADIYLVDAQYEPNLPNYPVSRAFAFMNNPQLAVESGYPRVNGKDYIPHYKDHPIAFSNGWSAIDDNDDDDFYVENRRRPYPSELASGLTGQFFGDGAMRSNNEQSWGGRTGEIRLPTGFNVVYDDNDGVIAERYDRNRDGVLDYRQDFLLFDADPPALSLDADRNNNKVFDLEEDDLSPDFPYDVSYEYTSNGIQSLGVRGGRCLLNMAPIPYVNVEVGGVYEWIQDPDLDGKSESVSGLGYGKNASVYSFTTYNYRDRATGITVFAGEELKKVNDGIKNDVIVARRDESNDMVFRLEPDMLELKNALVSKSVCGVKYSGIENLYVGASALVGFEKHFESDSVLVYRAYSDTVFTQNFLPYEDKLITSQMLLAKASYRIRPAAPFRGMAAPLNGLLSRLEITPQYKLMYEANNSREDDPRLGDDAVQALYDAGDTAAVELSRLAWHRYVGNNERLLYSVPIIRFTYEIGAKTYLEGGFQWKRVYNLGVDEDNYLKRSTVIQLRNKTTYLGYDISIICGVNLIKNDYDIQRRNDLYDLGTRFNDRKNEMFFRIYAGAD